MFSEKMRKWKVGDKWDDRRYVAQGKYFNRIGKKKAANRMFGKAGAIKRWKPEDKYIMTWSEWTKTLPPLTEEERYMIRLREEEEELEDGYYRFRVDFDIRFEKES